MIELHNGFPVHAVWLVAGEQKHGTMPQYGVVLSETPDNWVVWSIHWDPNVPTHIPADDDLGAWCCTSGEYFHKGMAQQNPPLDPKALAEFAFGLKCARYISAQVTKGIKSKR